MSMIKTRPLALEEIDDLAGIVAKYATDGDVIALSGEVGAGKTTFAQAFIGALLRTPENVISPTFTLVQSYDTKHPWRVVHADLYRLKHVDELVELGLEEAFEAQVALVEWPEIAAGILPEGTLYIHLEHAADDCRNITLTTASPRWQEFVA